MTYCLLFPWCSIGQSLPAISYKVFYVSYLSLKDLIFISLLSLTPIHHLKDLCCCWVPTYTLLMQLKRKNLCDKLGKIAVMIKPTVKLTLPVYSLHTLSGKIYDIVMLSQRPCGIKFMKERANANISILY